MDTPSKSDPGQKKLAFRAHRILPTHPLEKSEKKDGADKPVHDERDDAISSHQKPMSHTGQEEGQTILETPSRAAPRLKNIGASRSQNNSDISSRKDREKDRADKPVHDKGDDAIASQQISTFLVQSHVGQDEGRTAMVDNVSMADPVHFTQDTTELTAPPAQVTTHTQNSMDTYTKKITKRKMVEREPMMTKGFKFGLCE